MLYAALLRCTSYNGNAIFSGNHSISFAQDSKVRAGLDWSRRTRRVAQDSTVLADRTRRFAQDSTGRAELDGSRRTRRFAQDSTLLAATAPHSDGRLTNIVCISSSDRTFKITIGIFTVKNLKVSYRIINVFEYLNHYKK